MTSNGFTRLKIRLSYITSTRKWNWYVEYFLSDVRGPINRACKVFTMKTVKYREHKNASIDILTSNDNNGPFFSNYDPVNRTHSIVRIWGCLTYTNSGFWPIRDSVQLQCINVIVTALMTFLWQVVLSFIIMRIKFTMQVYRMYKYKVFGLMSILNGR